MLEMKCIYNLKGVFIMFNDICNKKFHKVVYLICFVFFCTVFALCTSVDAAYFVTVHKKHLNMPRNNIEEAQVQFMEENRIVRFATKRMENGTFRLLGTGELNWIGIGKEYWRYQDYPAGKDAYPSFIVTQYKDVETGHFFYGINFITYGEDCHRAMLVGFNDKREVMNTYIDSNNFPKNRYDEVFLFENNGNLYMSVAQVSKSRVVPGYKLYWADQNNWFGYEYVNNVNE